MAIRKLLENNWFKFAVVPLLVIIPILVFSLPLMKAGSANLAAITCYDNDEAGIIEFAGEIYSKGLVPMNGYFFSYPQLFYYLAGAVLFPFTYFHGINYHVITVVIRSFNLFFGIATVFLVFFITWELFKSYFVSLLSALLVATTPEYLWWLVNSRCHPMEIFFLLLGLYFSATIVNGYTPKKMLLALLSISIAASTKYGGFFLIPSLWAACIITICGMGAGELATYLDKRNGLISAVSALMILAPAAAASAFIFTALRHPEVFVRLGVHHIDRFLNISTLFPFFMVLSAVLITGCCWYILNARSSKIQKDASLREKHRLVLISNKSFFVLLQIVIVVLLVFIFLNPTYWLFPKSTLKATVYQVGQTVLTTKIAAKNEILDPGSIVWFKYLFQDRLLGAWFGLLFLVYAVLEVFNFKINLAGDKGPLFQRATLVIYASVLLLTLLVAVSHRAHHYLLPITFVASILLSYGVNEAVSASGKTRRAVIAVAAAALLAAGFYTRYVKITENYGVKTAQALECKL